VANPVCSNWPYFEVKQFHGGRQGEKPGVPYGEGSTHRLLAAVLNVLAETFTGKGDDDSEEFEIVHEI